jgi:phage-related protein
MKKSFKEIRDEVSTQPPKFDQSLGRRFEVKHLDAAKTFLKLLNHRCADHINSVIDKAPEQRDSKIMKKLTKDLWEFRIRHEGLQYRLLAFWAKDDERRLMLTTHAFVKKTNKVPLKELQRAYDIRSQYLTFKRQEL